MSRPILAALAALVVAACAPTGPVPGAQAGDGARACFLTSSVVNFRADGDTTAYVRTSRDEVYELAAAGLCRGLSTATSLGVSEASGASMSACTGDYVNISVGGPRIGGNYSGCRAQVVRRMSEDEVAALPSRVRP